MYYLPDKGVNFRNIDVIELLNRSLDVVLVGASVDNEYQSIVVLNFLHGCFRCQRILYDIVSIHAVKNYKNIT